MNMMKIIILSLALMAGQASATPMYETETDTVAKTDWDINTSPYAAQRNNFHYQYNYSDWSWSEQHDWSWAWSEQHDWSWSDHHESTVVLEPATVALFGIGLLMMLVQPRRKLVRHTDK